MSIAVFQKLIPFLVQMLKISGSFGMFNVKSINQPVQKTAPRL